MAIVLHGGAAQLTEFASALEAWLLAELPAELQDHTSCSWQGSISPRSRFD
jgi:hypothetical protein